jgi:hypothetical protein
LGGLSWWVNKKPVESKTPGDTSTKLLTIPDDQFQEIKIKKLTGELIDLVKDSGKWRMTQPQPLAADQDAAGGMVTTLANLSADKLVEEKATDLKAYGLDIPTLDVQVVRKDGKTDRLLERYRQALRPTDVGATLWISPTHRSAAEVRGN